PLTQIKILASMSIGGLKMTGSLEQAHVRFTPNSDRESGLPQMVMSALPPKADMCGATSRCLLYAKRGHQGLSPREPLGVKAGCFSIARIEPISLIQCCAERDHTCNFGVNWSR